MPPFTGARAGLDASDGIVVLQRIGPTRKLSKNLVCQVWGANWCLEYTVFLTLDLRNAFSQ